MGETIIHKLKSSLKNIQEIKNQFFNNDGDLKAGDIVLNRRDGEYGIVLGPCYPNFEGKDASGVMSISARLHSNPHGPSKLCLGGVSTKGKVVMEMYYIILSSESTGCDRETLCSDLDKVVTILKPNCPMNLSKLGEEDKKFFTRIKYVKRKYLTDVSLLTGTESTANIDLEYFCKNQCIMECSSECVFHKYGYRSEEE